MDQDELKLYEAMGNYATAHLFWSLLYMNNALLGTPMQYELKEKLLSMSKSYQKIILSVYQTAEAQKLVNAMENNNRLFISYMEAMARNTRMCGRIKEQWLENGKQIALLLAAMNQYWKAQEWLAMIHHEISLLEKAAEGIQAKNYSAFTSMAPVCKRLAIDMAKYMSSGVIQERMD